MRLTEQEAAQQLRAWDDIQILCHADPDGDTIGSAFGLYFALVQIGKRVIIRCNDPFHTKYAYLTQQYKQPDQFSAAYTVAVDIATTKLLGKDMLHLADRVDLAIDHHQSHQEYAKATLLDAKASAAALVVYRLIEPLGAVFSHDIANALYTGLATDTGCFKFSNTTAQAHRAAASLIECGADYDNINRLMFETKSLGRLQLERLVLDTLRVACNGRCAGIFITRDMLVQTGAQENELDGIVSIPRQIEGVEAGISVREKEDGSFKVSLRTHGAIDASDICAVFGGGGHARAAGCVMHGTIDEVFDRLAQEVEDRLSVCAKS